MKNKILMILISMCIGILFTFSFLNKKTIYAKEENLVFAFQVASFDSLESANKYKDTLSNCVIVKDNNTYNIIVGIYKDIDVVNKMLVYFENKDININLKNIGVNKKIYDYLNNMEKILINTNDENIYNKVNQSILDMYINGDNV